MKSARLLTVRFYHRKDLMANELRRSVPLWHRNLTALDCAIVPL